jgi:alginate O-acetyltransferase complex protein AlgI
MVFSSHVFLYYFLPIALLLYYASPTRWRQMIVALLSYVFYGWANPWFVLLMLFSTTVDYFCGLLIAGRWRLPIFAGDPPAEEGLAPARQRKLALVASIVVNLSLLGFFKYLGFAQANLNYLLEVLGRPALELYTVILPVGISFYTFQSMSYSIDSTAATRVPQGLPDFACYVSLFPQLVAGPIVRYQDLADQLRLAIAHPRASSPAGCSSSRFGMAKKVLLANPMGKLPTPASGRRSALVRRLDRRRRLRLPDLLRLQRLLRHGHRPRADARLEFKRNFDCRTSPVAHGVLARWHISLSTWLRDYLYIPLGGNRASLRRTYCNLAITMLLGGLWHGASVDFVIWGAIHGSLLAFERWRGKRAIYARLPRPLPALCTFVVVLITWVFFRAETLAGALSYTGSMLGIVEPSAASPLVGPLLYQPQYLMVMAACVLIHLLRLDTWELAQEARPKRMALASAAMVASAVILFTQSYNPFLYFRF